MDASDDDVHPASEMESIAQPPPEALISDAAAKTKKHKPSPSRATKSLEITRRTIKAPAFSYACLERIVSDPTSKEIPPLDDLTVRSYLTSALTQFLGLTGAAISIDILKVEPDECWIRVPREDLSAVIAAVGGWVGRGENAGEVGWRIRASGNWLGSLVGARGVEKVWTA